MDTPLFELRELEHVFWQGRSPRRAVDGVSLRLYSGEIFGLVGESGSGKTTLGRCICGVYPPAAGQLFYQGRDVCSLSRGARKQWIKQTQLIYQSASASLSPRLKIWQIVSEAYAIAGQLRGRGQRQERAAELLEAVGLPRPFLFRYPFELSGGQRQRVALARALAIGPQYLVADEPLSALDASVQAQISALLLRLREQNGLGCLFIAHDLGQVRRICSRIGVMLRGKLVELAETEELFARPLHPYTKRLLAARLSPDPACPPPRLSAPSLESLEGAWREAAPGHFLRA